MKVNNEALKIKRLQFEDIEDAMKLVLDAGWNQTEKDWELFIKNPQNICLKAEIDENLVATATAMNYANQLAWIGMVLVNKANRGKGLATMLMTTLMKMLSSVQSVKLDATPAGRQVYIKIGFADEYQINRMVNPSLNIELHNDSDIVPVRISQSDYQKIIDFDKKAFGMRRDDLLNYLITDFPQVAWVVMQNSMVAGFILGRQGNKHVQIGPVSAQNPEIAKCLIIHALKELYGKSVVLDILDDKTELIDWLESLGFVIKREFLRMYKHSNPFPGNSDLQYLICGPEFG